jgi:hypothetical protein
MEEMERIGNGEDPNSFNRRILMPSGAEGQGGPGVAVVPPSFFNFLFIVIVLSLCIFKYWALTFMGKESLLTM